MDPSASIGGPTKFMGSWEMAGTITGGTAEVNLVDEWRSGRHRRRRTYDKVGPVCRGAELSPRALSRSRRALALWVTRRSGDRLLEDTRAIGKATLAALLFSGFMKESQLRRLTGCAGRPLTTGVLRQRQPSRRAIWQGQPDLSRSLTGKQHQIGSSRLRIRPGHRKTSTAKRTVFEYGRNEATGGNLVRRAKLASRSGTTFAGDTRIRP